MMPGWLVLPYLVVFATLAQALLVSAKVLPRSCARCGLPLERRRMGQRICGCGHTH
jgi:uncharacterized Zn finger protein (UPF0148 family)